MEEDGRHKETIDQVLRGIGWGTGNTSALQDLGPGGAQVTGEAQSKVLCRK